jgi:hypothetical protein
MSNSLIDFAIPDTIRWTKTKLKLSLREFIQPPVTASLFGIIVRIKMLAIIFHSLFHIYMGLDAVQFGKQKKVIKETICSIFYPEFSPS